jgi:hypothetical protein
MGLAPHPEVRHVLETPAAVVAASLSSFGEPGPPLKKACTKGYLLSMHMWDVVCCLCYLSIFIPELMIFEQEAYIRDSELSPVGAPTDAPNVLASKRDGACGSSEGGLCERIAAGGTDAGEESGGACHDGGSK